MVDGPNPHFTIDWYSYSFSGRTASLRFQAHLYENGVVEFHYCTLSDTGTSVRYTGSEATVGIEGSSGLTGIQHSHNQANAVSTTSAIRFTPAP
jgi:hypothetical protein